MSPAGMTRGEPLNRSAVSSIGGSDDAASPPPKKCRGADAPERAHGINELGRRASVHRTVLLALLDGGAVALDIDCYGRSPGVFRGRLGGEVAAPRSVRRFGRQRDAPRLSARSVRSIDGAAATRSPNLGGRVPTGGERGLGAVRDSVLNVLWGSQQRSCMSARSVQIDVLASSDALAHGRYRIVGALSCNPQVDHECVQRPHPQVVGLPPLDLAKQVGICTARIIAASPDRVSLVRCRDFVCASGVRGGSSRMTASRIARSRDASAVSMRASSLTTAINDGMRRAMRAMHPVALSAR
jgi:hypothetical protein